MEGYIKVTYIGAMRTFITDPNTYETLDQVPLQLQHNIAFAYSTGVPVEALAIIYDMPVNWVKLFVDCSTKPN